MTELLYATDAYLRSFEARVEAVDAERIALDRTAFYPTGGGQPHDMGTLRLGAGPERSVAEVRRDAGRVWHTVPGHSASPGDTAHGAIDWSRRHRLMRTHTALHVLCGVIYRDYGARVTGSQMEPLRARIDFELTSMTSDFVGAVERAVAAELAADRRIEVGMLSRAEAEKVPDLIRTKVNLLPADIDVVRTVDIVGLDKQADGGTHVRSTSEVGRVEIVDYRSKGKSNKRLVIEIHPE
jgi:misacylated tRNA(Ala) deacylase